MKLNLTYIVIFLVSLSGCLATGKKFNELLPITNDRALVYVYHPRDAQFGSTEADFLYLNGEEVFRFTHEGYSYFYLEPGTHKFQIRLSTFFVATEQVKQELELKVDAGETYFVRYYEQSGKTEFYSTGSSVGAYNITNADLKLVSEKHALYELSSKRLLKHKNIAK